MQGFRCFGPRLFRGRQKIVKIHYCYMIWCDFKHARSTMLARVAAGRPGDSPATTDPPRRRRARAPRGTSPAPRDRAWTKTTKKLRAGPAARRGGRANERRRRRTAAPTHPSAGEMQHLTRGGRRRRGRGVSTMARDGVGAKRRVRRSCSVTRRGERRRPRAAPAPRARSRRRQRRPTGRGALTSSCSPAGIGRRGARGRGRGGRIRTGGAGARACFGARAARGLLRRGLGGGLLRGGLLRGRLGRGLLRGRLGRGLLRGRLLHRGLLRRRGLLGRRRLLGLLRRGLLRRGLLLDHADGSGARAGLRRGAEVGLGGLESFFLGRGAPRRRNARSPPRRGAPPSPAPSPGPFQRRGRPRVPARGGVRPRATR